MHASTKQKLLHHPNVYRLSDNAGHREILKYMREIARNDAATCEYLDEILSGVHPSDFENIPLALFECVGFIPDVNGMQIIQHPKRLLENGEGNCVDYTVFISAAAKKLGLPVKMRMVDFGNGFEHVYPVVNGFVYDLNYWQKFGPARYSLPGVDYMEISV